MSRQLKMIAFAAFTVLLGACGDLTTSPELAPATQPRGRTVVVDSTRMSLVGDAATAIRTGTFRFALHGQADVAPGDVIVGVQDGGFLRNVTSVRREGDVLVLATTQADLAQALGENASFSASIPVELGSGAQAPAGARYQLGSLKVSGLANGISLGSKSWNLSNTTLVDIPVCPAGKTTNCPRLRAGIQSGSISLNAQVDLGATIGWSGLSGAFLRVDGTAGLTMTGFAELAGGSRAGTWEKSLGTASRTFVGTVAGLPIAGKITTEVIAQATLNVNTTTRVTTGASTSATATVGAQWTRGVGFQRLAGVQTQASAQPLQVTNYPQAALKVLLIPRVTVSVYGIPTDSYASIKPWLSAQVRGDPARKTVPYTVTFGVDGEAGVNFRVFSKSLGTWNYNTTLYSKVLLSR